LTFPGGGSLVVTEGGPEQNVPAGGYARHRVMVRVSDIDSHHRHATQRGRPFSVLPSTIPTVRDNIR
jgi:hypothetical protein